ncbi:NTP transferase domain-containing protein [Pseudodesulfovibrio sp. JC047]|uniref:cytidylyltransferase domain-containing protein n=1 Tax=Pseudodesulfovibrio sp. JC047 TaxID=2683199 RepID=UPI0013D13363|nr:glycosyltransferase family protein [Pseudodesulfovibrio sp. JC047]NDV20645.1 NTP transferase domain-containing protein [Pseudodesulfovibrio sp. JC047]
MKNVIIIQARTGSSRLPGKVLHPLAEQPMILHVLARASQSMADTVVLATSREPSDDALADMVHAAGYPVVRGSLDDVLDRYVMAARTHQADTVVRITGDCPLVDPDLIDHCLRRHEHGDCDYVSTAYPNPSYPDGLDVEVFSRAVLEQAWESARKPSEREHVTPFIWTHPDRFRLESIVSPTDLSHLRWTVDEPQDMDFMRHIFDHIDPATARMQDILAVLDAHPELETINQDIRRNEGYETSLKADAQLNREDPK